MHKHTYACRRFAIRVFPNDVALFMRPYWIVLTPTHLDLWPNKPQITDASRQPRCHTLAWQLNLSPLPFCPHRARAGLQFAKNGANLPAPGQGSSRPEICPELSGRGGFRGTNLRYLRSAFRIPWLSRKRSDEDRRNRVAKREEVTEHLKQAPFS